MSDQPPGVYLPTANPDVYESTVLANAGWYDEGQHGGALAALVAGHIDTVPTLVEMAVTRFTLELFRVVPLVPLRLESSIIREGKRIQVIEVRIVGPDGTELSRAHIQRIRVAEVGLPDGVDVHGPDFAGPEALEAPSIPHWGYGPKGKVMFHRNAIEIREVRGGYETPGPGTFWMRVVQPIVAGRETTPLQRLVVTADFCNGLSRLTLDPKWLFMNPDLTININRYPKSDWVALDAESAYSSHGRGLATGSLYDTERFLGRSIQTLFFDRTDRHA